MSKINLNNVVSGFNLSRINQNFQTIKQFLDNNVLCRNNPTGTPNTMQNDLDMNGKKIYNLNGLTFTAPNGKKYQLTVDNSGALGVVEI